MRWNPLRNIHVYLDVYSDNFTSKYDYWQTTEKEAYDETRKRTHYTNETLKGIFRLASWNKLSGGMELVQEALTSEVDHINFETSYTYNLFAQDEINVLSNLDAVLGLRYTYNNHFDSHFTPSVGVFFHQSEFRARLSYAGGYRTPTLSQLYATDQAKTNSRYTINNPALKPEKSHFLNLSLEYGTRWMTMSLTGFYNHVRDMINYRTLTQEEIEADATLVTLHEEWTTIRQRANMDEVTLKGISATVKLLIPWGLSLGGGYTFTDAKEVDKSVRHVGTVNATYDKSWGKYHLNVTLNGHVQSRRYSSTYGYAPGYGQWDLTTAHTVTLDRFVLEPGVGIENLFNKVDHSYWTSNFSTISPGRSLYISLALKFK